MAISTREEHARTPVWLILSLSVLSAFAPLSVDLYLPSLPDIAEGLHAEIGQVQLTLATFMFGMGIGQLIYGPLSDRYGRRAPLMWGIAIYTVASLGCALASSVEALIALRFLQALGGAAGPVIARAVVRDMFSGPDIARMLSIIVLVTGAAPILAPVLGGLILTVGGWRANFYVLAGAGVLAAALTDKHVPPDTPPKPTAALTQNLKRLVVHKQFVTSAVAAACAQAILFAYISSAPFVYMELHQLSAQEFAVIFGTNATGFISATQCNRWLLRRFSMLGIARAGAAWLCLANAGLLLVVYFHGDTVTFSVIVFACVAGLGFVLPNVSAVALHDHADIAGLASSVLGAGQFGSAAIAASLVADGDSALPMALAMSSGSVGAFLATALLATARSTQNLARARSLST